VNRGRDLGNAFEENRYNFLAWDPYRRGLWPAARLYSPE